MAENSKEPEKVMNPTLKGLLILAMLAGAGDAQAVDTQTAKQRLYDIMHYVHPTSGSTPWAKQYPGGIWILSDATIQQSLTENGDPTYLRGFSMNYPTKAIHANVDTPFTAQQDSVLNALTPPRPHTVFYTLDSNGVEKPLEQLTHEMAQWFDQFIYNGPPTGPTRLTIKPVTNSGNPYAELRWNASPDTNQWGNPMPVVKYLVFKNGDIANLVIPEHLLAEVVRPDTFFTDAILPADTAHYFQVTAKDSIGAQTGLLQSFPDHPAAKNDKQQNLQAPNKLRDD